MDITLVEESNKDKLGAAQHVIRIYSGRSRDGKVLYEVKSKRYLDVISKSLHWCQSKFANIYKIHFADGNVWTNDFQHSLIMNVAFDSYDNQTGNVNTINNKTVENNN